MEAKKISFGFMKTKKADKPAVVEKKDYIECVEEKSIKVIGGEAATEDKPLVIPMKPNTLITAEKLREIAEKAENFEDVKIKTEEQEIKVNLVPENETLEQMAARELLEEAKKEIVVDESKLVVPVNTKPIFDGQTESTLDDYESVPVQEFGLAMLRGMGWTQGKESTYKQPQLRPKGLGLGADKVITDKKKNNTKDKEEELQIVKNSYVKVTTGKHSGYYGKVVSLDEDNGRVVVELAIKKETVSLSEFMVQAVSKSVFDKESKVIMEAIPVLWDKTKEDYEDKNFKTEEWKDVGQNIFPSFDGKEEKEKTKLGNDFIQKWTSIIDNFKNVKKLEDSKISGAGAKCIKEYHVHKKLMFFQKNTPNVSDDSLSLEEESETSTKRSRYQPYRTTPTEKLSCDEFERRSIQTLSTSVNRHLSFFKSILPSLNRLNDHQTLLFQSGVLKIIMDLRQPPYQSYSGGGYQTSYDTNYQQTTRPPQATMSALYDTNYHTALDEIVSNTSNTTDTFESEYDFT